MTKHEFRTVRFSKSSIPFLIVLMLTLLVSACSSNNNTNSSQEAAATASNETASNEAASSDTSSTSTSSTSESSEKALIPITQITNWYAQAEHGGNYTALAKGFYKDAGFDMTITPGVNVSGTQLLLSGKAQFAMSSSDEVLVARDQGIPVVAILGTFQKSPQSFTYHEGQGIKSIEDLNGRTVYVSNGITYWEFLKKKFDLSKTKQMKYNYELASFMADDKSVVQSYITAEPYVLDQQGVKVGSLLIADYGYSPYANVMITTESFLKEHPDEVQAFVDATIKGWDYYKDHSDEINPSILKENPDESLDRFAYSSKALQPLVYGGDAETKGVGTMTTERWEEMNKQLLDLGVIKKSQDVSKAFTDEFVEKANAAK
ncbi:ABC transporter substrate-binding protein [Paenibacillus sp. OV219]|uniref:ABC transporter substrate-binding protein n=1 Tax=Paenibacillus sp. OV219 TaxID=1884377 RepID=UPI0008D271A4|nr:ABC transporter substrate-binding protein [Paenibacillus sp. OV219]SEO76832.1 NitT/TauT family transport system substrate-binding protein [Paenibacillus sp. OV219]